MDNAGGKGKFFAGGRFCNFASEFAIYAIRWAHRVNLEIGNRKSQIAND
jgi:hypothetical protein